MIENRAIRQMLNGSMFGILCVMAANVQAAEIALVGIFPGKAVLTIDGSAPHSLSPGQSFGAVKLISVEHDAAVVESAGKRERVLLGGQPYTVGASSDSGDGPVKSVTLVADGRGHFMA